MRVILVCPSDKWGTVGVLLGTWRARSVDLMPLLVYGINKPLQVSLPVHTSMPDSHAFMHSSPHMCEVALFHILLCSKIVPLFGACTKKVCAKVAVKMCAMKIAILKSVCLVELKLKKST